MGPIIRDENGQLYRPKPTFVDWLLAAVWACAIIAFIALLVVFPAVQR